MGENVGHVCGRRVRGNVEAELYGQGLCQGGQGQAESSRG